jgi:hypothetical protein
LVPGRDAITAEGMLDGEVARRSDDEPLCKRGGEIEREKESARVLTTTRSSREVKSSREDSRTAARRGALSSAMAAAVLGFCGESEGGCGSKRVQTG